VKVVKNGTMTDQEVYNNRVRIGARIAFIRKRKNMTQFDLAEKSGIKQPNISRIELGKYATTVDVLFKLAESLGADLNIIII
jgi:transcriptional regulator with XRE-family HTH domain